MPWPTWQQSAAAAVLSALTVVALRRSAGLRWQPVLRAANELMIITSLYSVWRMARKLPWKQADGAIERAYDIVDWQQAMFLPTELSLQRLVMRWDLLAKLTSIYYAGAHVPFLLAFLVWLFWRHFDHFARWRNVLAIVTAFSLFIRFVRVAPPRFLTELGYVDLPELHGLSVYGPVGAGVSPQFAAMPSIHVAWASIVSFGVVAASSNPRRWLALGHVVLTMLVVAATGHHWWLDGIVALGLLWVAMGLESAGRRVLAQVTSGRGGSGHTVSRTESKVVGESSPSMAENA